MAAVLSHFRSVQPSLGHPNVIRAAGIIRGVSVITAGPARGHGVYVDATTLQQVKACANSFRGGVAVKFNKSTFDHGPGSIAGSLRDCRVVGDRLLGDIYLLESFEDREYLLELASTQPDSFGLSIDFEMRGEEREGRTFARCLKLDAVTVVDVPAANNGLFHAGMKPFATPTSMSPSVIRLFSKAALDTTKNTHMSHTTFAKTAIGFAARIAHFQATGKSRGQAILLARAADRTGFNQWCSENRPGEAASEQNPIAHGMKGFRITGC